MSALLRFRKSLQETHDIISRLEQDLAEQPGEWGVRLNLISFRRLRARIESEFDAEVAKARADARQHVPV